MANPNFRETPSTSSIKKIRINIIQSSQTALQNFLTGKIDFLGAPEGYESKLEELKKLKAQIVEAPRFDLTYIGFNMEHPILGTNVELRKAIAIAIDRKTLVKAFYKKRAQVLSGPIPRGLFGYESSNIVAIDGDLDAAKSLLARAGFPDGKNAPILTLSISSVDKARQFGEYIKDRLSKIGIRLKVSITDWPQFERKVKATKADMFLMSWVADYPDPEAFMQLFYGPNISPGSNASNFTNGKYDRLCLQLQSQTSPAHKGWLIEEMSMILKTEQPVIFLAQRKSHLLVQESLEYQNFHPSIFDSYKYLKR